MGDSIGIRGNGAYDDSTSTLGPCLTISGGSYWLANFHPFVDAFQHLPSLSVEHPSPCDRSWCIEERHDVMEESEEFGIGDLTATSGLDLKTTRITHDSYWEEMDKDAPLIVTDWVIIGAKTQQANILRIFPSEHLPPMPSQLITSTAGVTPGATVCSSGRTSGNRRGEVCEIPAYVDGLSNGTGRATREWYIEEPSPYDSEEGWIRGGIGVEGDSGAAIVDCDTNAIVGQLWGRNKYWGPGPRHTYFTPIRDIFDDIQEKCGQQSRPQLPRLRDEAERFPVYPTCRQCYDLRTYLGSRRSSRESLRSMVAGRNGSDQDLTSIEAVSELATPKDHNYYLRHMGADEFMPPAAVNPFSSFSFSKTPGTPSIVDIKSPYAMTLQAEDLYDGEYGSPKHGTGKRPALPFPLCRSASNEGNGSGKRQRQR
jgi:hypothetical protein